MTMVRTIIILIFACISLSSYSQSISSEVYVIECVYDANGNKIIGEEKKVYPEKIMVMVFPGNIFLPTTASYIEYNSLFAHWEDTHPLRFKYAGKNNGWDIFRLDLGMLVGTHFLYIYHDYSYVRVAMSYNKGKFYQYRKFIEGEDINMTPTR